MVVKFQSAGGRGAAGESFSNPKRGYNFANLYKANKATGEGNDFASGIESEASGIRNRAADALQRNVMDGSSQGNNDSMANAVESAKNLSNRTENWSFGNEAAKAGAGASQSAAIDFFGGGKGVSNRVQKFGNIYQATQGKQQELMNAQNRGVGASVVKEQEPRRRGFENLGQEESAIRDRNENKVRQHGMGALRSMDSMEWALKTGRITQEQYARASQDPEYYQTLVDSF